MIQKEKETLNNIETIISISEIKWEKIQEEKNKVFNEIKTIMKVINYEDNFTIFAHNSFTKNFFTTKTDTIDFIIQLSLVGDENEIKEKGKKILLSFWREFESKYAENLPFKAKSTNEIKLNKY